MLNSGNHRDNIPLGHNNSKNSRHTDIHFTFGIEKHGSLPFLDVRVSHNDNQVPSCVYRKKPLSHSFFISYPLLQYLGKEASPGAGLIEIALA